MSTKCQAKSAQQQNTQASVSQALENKLSKPTKTHGKYFWAEIVKHDSEEDCWVVIHGKVYDITTMLPQHTGGYAILAGAGGDVTAIFESQHPLAIIKQGPPKRYLIGEVRDYKPQTCWKGDFYLSLKEKVETAIPKIQRRVDDFQIIKTILIITFYFYSVYRWYQDMTFLNIIILSFFIGQIGVNIQHDGSHRAFTPSRTISWLAGLTMDFVSASSRKWQADHNMSHHQYTQHYEKEYYVMEAYPAVRLHPGYPRLRHHRYQHWIMLIYPCLSTYGFIKNSVRGLWYFNNTPFRRVKPPMKEIIIHLTGKFWSFFATLFLPIYKHGFLLAFPMWVAFLLIVGHFFAWFIILNHWTAQNSHTFDKNYMEEHWAIKMIKNGTNFGNKGTFWLHLTGGLNFHREHHLFPGYCHGALPRVAEILREHCKEYGIEYREYDNMFDCLKGHIKFMKIMGSQDNPDFSYEGNKNWK